MAPFDISYTSFYSPSIVTVALSGSLQNVQARVDMTPPTGGPMGHGAGVKCEVRGGKMRGTGARYQCEALGNLRGWNVRGAADNWHKRVPARHSEGPP